MRRDKLRIALTLFVICAVFMAAVKVTANLIANPGFQGSEGMLPSDWMIFSGALGRQLLFVEDDENPAQKMLMIDDPSSSHGYGLRRCPVARDRKDVCSLSQSKDGTRRKRYFVPRLLG